MTPKRAARAEFYRALNAEQIKRREKEELMELMDVSNFNAAPIRKVGGRHRSGRPIRQSPSTSPEYMAGKAVA